MAGPLKISEMDIFAYSINRKVEFDLWEIDAIDKIDDIYLKIYYEKNKGEE